MTAEEIARLRAIADPDGTWISVARVLPILARLEAAEKSLKPLADENTQTIDGDEHSDSLPLWEAHQAHGLTVGDVRRARAALAKEG